VEIEAIHPDGVLTGLKIDGTEWELRMVAMRLIEAAADGRAEMTVGEALIEVTRVPSDQEPAT